MSSSPDSFQNAFDSYKARQELDSPFLNEEYLVEEARTAQAWRTSVPGFQLESPFLEAFEEGWGAISELEVEESEVLLPHDLLLDREIIPPDDSRALVPQNRDGTLPVPYCWVCAIDFYIKNKRGNRILVKRRATGTLIGSRHVLTAAHIFEAAEIGTGRDKKLMPIERVVVSPARHGSNSRGLLGAIPAKKWICSRYWKTKRNNRDCYDPNHDYALIVLEQDVALQMYPKSGHSILNYWGHPEREKRTVIQRLDPSFLDGKKVEIIGYPGDRCGRDIIVEHSKERKIRYCQQRLPDEWASTQWRGRGELMIPTTKVGLHCSGRGIPPIVPASGLIEHTVDTYGGQSGAPVCLSSGNDLYLVGIHIQPGRRVVSDHAITFVSNYAVRITRRLLSELCSWINADAGSNISSIQNDRLVVGAITEFEVEESDEVFDKLDEEEFEKEEASSAFFNNEWESEIEELSEFQDELEEEEFDEEVEEDIKALEFYDEESNWQIGETGEIELQVPKLRTKKLNLHNILTTDIFIHVYFKKLSTNYTEQQFFDWVVGQNQDAFQPNRFQLVSIEIHLINDSSTAVSDFKRSLQIPGSVVIYFGHTVLGRKTTLGLSPKDPPLKKPDITCSQLTNLLNTAKAKLVVLAGCATSQCVTKIKGDTAVIVTQSGKDRLTNTLQWAPAIKLLLDELLDGGTVGDALAAANKEFAKVSSTDSFKMINGDPTLKMR